MNKTRSLLLLVGVGVGAILVVAWVSMTMQMALPQPLRTATTLINPKEATFEIQMEDTYQITSGSTVTIPIDVRGVSASAGKGIAGFALSVTKLPSAGMSPTVTLSGKSWTINKNHSSDGIYRFVSNGPTDPFVSDTPAFITLVLEHATPGDVELSLTIADNLVPSQSHNIPNMVIHLQSPSAPENGGPFSFNAPSTIMPAGKQINIPIGFKGASLTSQVDGLTVMVAEMPAFLSNCTVATSRTSWEVLSNTVPATKTLKAAGVGADNPITAEISSLYVVTCDVTGTLTPQTITLNGDLSTVNPKKTYHLPAQTIALSSGVTDCYDLGKGIFAPVDVFNIADITELERGYLKLSSANKDINGDNSFDYADVVGLVQCNICKWKWSGCP